MSSETRAERLGRTISVPRPADFDEFWTTALAELASVDPETTFELRSDLSSESVDVFDVRFTSLEGVRVAAWYTRPAGVAAAASLPGLMISPGYISEPLLGKAWSKRGYAVMGVSPRGKLRADSQVNPGYPGLLVSEILDPYRYTYRGFYLDAVRALDVLDGVDEVDSSRLAAMGSSQGGGLSLIVAALRPRVSCAVIGAPFLVGMIEAASLTSSYPYQEISDYLKVHPDSVECVQTVLSYFDGLNFADRVTVDTLMHFGLRDDVCAPEVAYALAQALPKKPELHVYAECGHDAGLPAATVPICAFLDLRLHPVAAAGGQINNKELGLDI